MIKKSAIAIVFIIANLSAYAQQTYQLNVKKSKILWDTNKTVGQHKGEILFSSGSLKYDLAGLPESGAFTVDMNTMRTTDAPSKKKTDEVNAELRTPGFFDVKQYPTAGITVKKISRINNMGSYKVLADLTIKGITNPVEFTASIQAKGNIINVKADYLLDRNRWKIDMQEKPKQWNFFDAVKDKAVAKNILIALDLTFDIK